MAFWGTAKVAGSSFLAVTVVAVAVNYGFSADYSFSGDCEADYSFAAADYYGFPAVAMVAIAVDYSFPAVDYSFPVADYSFPAADYGFPAVAMVAIAVDYSFPAVDYGFPAVTMVAVVVDYISLMDNGFSVDYDILNF
ncbi:hypothetical protein BDZ91DRAFT_794585 [Kalaharituber pfeilii]|nr:hypothetical protein BDZ91DRAFT_794585 [Kalaharituber pfeilii]